MWDERKQQQLDELRQREQDQALTEEEHRVLEHLFHELEKEEWDALRPALESRRQEQASLQEECGRLQTQNAILAAIAERRLDLLARAKLQLAGLLSEHEVLKAEYERTTGQPLGGS